MHTENPLLLPFRGIYETAPFDQITIEHYMPAFETAIEEAREEIQQIIDQPAAPDFVNTIVALDMAGERLDRVRSIFFNLNSAETSEEMQNIAQELSPRLSDFSNDINLNEHLFARVREVYNQLPALQLTTEETTLLERPSGALYAAGPT